MKTKWILNSNSSAPSTLYNLNSSKEVETDLSGLMIKTTLRLTISS